MRRAGDHIDIKRLSLELGIPVVPISARTGQGVSDLLGQCETIIDIVHAQVHAHTFIEPDDVYDDYTHATHHRIGEIIGDAPERADIPAHWAQVKLLEGDTLVRGRPRAYAPGSRKELDGALHAYAGD